MQRFLIWLAVAVAACLAVIWWVSGEQVQQVVSILEHGVGVAVAAGRG